MSSNRHAETLRAYLEHNCRKSAATPPTPWPEWLRMTLGATMAVSASLALANCGSTEGRGVGGGDLLDPEKDGLEDIALSDDLVEIVRPLDLFAKIAVFGLKLMLGCLDLRERFVERLIGLLAAQRVGEDLPDEP